MIFRCNECGSKCCKEEWLEIFEHEFERLKKLDPSLTYYKKIGPLYILKPPCPFLTESGRCGCYQVRPELCQLYPFKEVEFPHLGVMAMGLNMNCPNALNVLSTDKKATILRKKWKQKLIKGRAYLIYYVKRMTKEEKMEMTKWYVQHPLKRKKKEGKPIVFYYLYSLREINNEIDKKVKELESQAKDKAIQKLEKTKQSKLRQQDLPCGSSEKTGK